MHCCMSAEDSSSVCISVYSCRIKFSHSLLYIICFATLLHTLRSVNKKRVCKYEACDLNLHEKVNTGFGVASQCFFQIHLDLKCWNIFFQRMGMWCYKLHKQNCGKMAFRMANTQKWVRGRQSSSNIWHSMILCAQGIFIEYIHIS